MAERTQRMPRFVRWSAANAQPSWRLAAVVLVATLGLTLISASAGAHGNSVPPTIRVPASVTVVGTRDATVRVAIHDDDLAFSGCDWAALCSSQVGVQIYGPAGKQVGIEVVFNSPTDRYLDEDLVVPVTLSPLLHPLPSGTYSVKVTTIAVDRYAGGDPSTVTTATATFALTHVPAAKLSLVRTVSEYQTHGWQITGVLKKNGSPWPGAKVTLQVKIPPIGWRKMLSKTTGKKGQVTFTSNPDLGSGRWSARLMAVGPNGETVVSKIFTLYRR